MTPTEAFIGDILEFATEEVLSRGASVTPEAQLEIIKIWIEGYEEVPPKNRPEKKIFNALELLADRLARHIKKTPQNV